MRQRQDEHGVQQRADESDEVACHADQDRLRDTERTRTKREKKGQWVTGGGGQFLVTRTTFVASACG